MSKTDAPPASTAKPNPQPNLSSKAPPGDKDVHSQEHNINEKPTTDVGSDPRFGATASAGDPPQPSPGTKAPEPQAGGIKATRPMNEQEAQFIAQNEFNVLGLGIFRHPSDPAFFQPTPHGGPFTLQLAGLTHQLHANVDEDTFRKAIQDFAEPLLKQHGSNRGPSSTKRVSLEDMQNAPGSGHVSTVGQSAGQTKLSAMPCPVLVIRTDTRLDRAQRSMTSPFLFSFLQPKVERGAAAGVRGWQREARRAPAKVSAEPSAASQPATGSGDTVFGETARETSHLDAVRRK